MIRVQFTYDAQQNIQSFECSGHAGAGPYGSDIVCAAVSALSISTVNGLEALAQLDLEVEVAGEEGGYLFCALPQEVSANAQKVAQILLKNFYLALQQIQEENAQYIQVSTQEVHTC